MNKYIVKLTCTDDCTYCFTESYPLKAKDMLEANDIVIKETERSYRDKNPHPTISGVAGHSLDDIEVQTLEEFFQFA